MIIHEEESELGSLFRTDRVTVVSQLKVDVPSDVSVNEARLLLAIKLFETGHRWDKRQKMADYSKKAFMEILAKAGVPLFDYPASELNDEIGV